LDSKTGFYSSPAEKGKEFWINLQFPDYNVYEATSIVLKKIDHKCCREATMDGFIVSYYYRNEWHQYNDGAVVKTGQMPEDAVTKERIIELNPSIKASMIKLTNPRNERSTNDAQGRVEIIVKGPVEKSNDKPKVEGGQRAILDLDSKTKQSSQWGSNWGGAQASSLESKTGFYNTPDENDKEFWIKTMFPDAKLYEVHQLVMKKIIHSCCGLKTMNGYIITYFNGKEWIQYDTGKV